MLYDSRKICYMCPRGHKVHREDRTKFAWLIKYHVNKMIPLFDGVTVLLIESNLANTFPVEVQYLISEMRLSSRGDHNAPNTT